MVHYTICTLEHLQDSAHYSEKQISKIFTDIFRGYYRPWSKIASSKLIKIVVGSALTFPTFPHFRNIRQRPRIITIFRHSFIASMDSAWSKQSVLMHFVVFGNMWSAEIQVDIAMVRASLDIAMVRTSYWYCRRIWQVNLQ